MTRRAAEIRLDALLRTACDVIAERGLANTRTADVAQAAGVSQALVFYHFATKERLLAQAYAYAVEQDLARLDAVVRSSAPPLVKLRRLIKLHTPTGRSASWSLWIDGWSESLRAPEVEKLSRRLDLRRREDLAAIISDGVREGTFDCPDPVGAAWRINAVMDGLAVQLAVHERVIPRRQSTEWIRLVAARELGLEPAQLDWSAPAQERSRRAEQPPRQPQPDSVG
ncbi:TetR/AcrR family transcriptional regulator [Micromonospora okii]|uniref:TetR/AcrR family transcriptional regulator n=1 Tax=Micromonospora okii TaxID=1182970 RepID=UPI001E327133|nr:TetR/AcrR family transcriptional regulator [Micromonospora okii]